MDDKLKIFKTIDPVILALLLLYYITKNDLFFVISLILLTSNIFFINISSIFAKYWLKLAMFLGFINSKIILTIAYVLFLTPLAYFFRIFNPILIFHFKLRKKTSYYYNHSSDIKPIFFEKQW